MEEGLFETLLTAGLSAELAKLADGLQVKPGLWGTRNSPKCSHGIFVTPSCGACLRAALKSGSGS